MDPERHAPESDWEMLRPRSEREHDYQALEQRVAALERAPRVDRMDPWWRNPKMVTVIASLLAVFIPLTTAVDGYFKGQSSLALAAEQQRHAMRMDYMKTALDPQAPEIERQSRLRLLIAILDADDPVRAWARAELGVVNQNVEELKTTLKNTQAELVQVQAEEQAARSKLGELETKLDVSATPAAPQAEQHALERELEQARKTLEDATQRKDHLSSRATKASQKLTGQKSESASL
jgi:hypothetical protein